MEKTWNVEKYLNDMQKKEIRVFVVNGFQLTGILQSFDDVSLKMRDCKDQKEKLVFFSAISTIEAEV